MKYFCTPLLAESVLKTKKVPDEISGLEYWGFNFSSGRQEFKYFDCQLSPHFSSLFGDYTDVIICTNTTFTSVQFIASYIFKKV